MVPALPVVPAATCPATAGALGGVAAGTLCSATSGVAGAAGSALGGLGSLGVGSVLDALGSWVTGGAVWLLARIGAALASSTAVDLSAPWFRAHYATMAALAGVVVVPLLLLGIVQAVYRQSTTLLLRSALVHLPLALLLTGVAVSFVQLGLAATDSLSAAVAHGAGLDSGHFLSGVADGLTAGSAGDPTGPPTFVVFLGGVAVVVGAVLVWLELLVRAAAVYVAVLFLPLALASLAWPAIAHWSRRLADTLVALVLSKFVVVAVLSLAAGALAGGAARPLGRHRPGRWVRLGARGRGPAPVGRRRTVGPPPPPALRRGRRRGPPRGPDRPGPPAGDGPGQRAGLGGAGVLGGRHAGRRDGRPRGHRGPGGRRPSGRESARRSAGLVRPRTARRRPRIGRRAGPLTWPRRVERPGVGTPSRGHRGLGAVARGRSRLRRRRRRRSGRTPVAARTRPGCRARQRERGTPPPAPPDGCPPGRRPRPGPARGPPRRRAGRPGSLRPARAVTGGTAEDGRARVRYRFPPLERRGVIAGWRGGQIGAVAGALVVAVLVARARPSADGVLVAVTVVAGGVALATWPVAGRTGEQWLPLLVRWAWAGRTGDRRQLGVGPRHGRLVTLAGAGRLRVGGPDRDPHGSGALAGLSVGAAPLEGNGAAMGVVHDQRARTATAVLALSGHSFALLGPADQDARVAAWARVLASLARDGSAVHRVQWLETCRPDDGSAVRRWLDGHAVLGDATPAARSYRDLLTEAGPVTRRHRVLLAVTVHRGRSARAVRAAGVVLPASAPSSAGRWPPCTGPSRGPMSKRRGCSVRPPLPTCWPTGWARPPPGRPPSPGAGPTTGARPPVRGPWPWSRRGTPCAARPPGTPCTGWPSGPGST